MQSNLNSSAQAHSKVKSGVVPSIQRPDDAVDLKQQQKQQAGDNQKQQSRASKTDQHAGKSNQNDKIKLIHNQLNENAETYTKMYDAIATENSKPGDGTALSHAKEEGHDSDEEEEEEEEEESEEDFIDMNILSKLRFQQSSERKQWQGVNVTYSGIPGTSTLNQNEGIMMFKEERAEMDAQIKVSEVFREIQEVMIGSLQYCYHQTLAESNRGSHKSKAYFANDYEQHGQLKRLVPIDGSGMRYQDNSTAGGGTVSNQYKGKSIINPGENDEKKMVLKRTPWSHLQNDYFIKFKFFEVMKSKNGGAVEINKSLIKKIQNINNQQSYFSMNGSNHQTHGQHHLCFYKMLKCESKLIRFMLELNGMMSTDRHDWNMLWTHTQGKTYFYERLNPTQKINHFPLSHELTRKDKLAQNIKQMQKKFSKAYFNFIPETYVLPDQVQEFEETFKYYEEKKKRSQGMPINLQKATKNNMWIVKPVASSQGKGIFIINKLEYVPRHEPCVISRYIDNPLLLYGHKFDLRIYVVVTCFDPLRVYVYREGLVRFASEKYHSSTNDQEEGSVFAHLTNYSINKKNENYVQNADAELDDSGFKWSFSAFQQHFKEEGIDVNLMWSKIYDVIIKSLVSIESVTKNQIKKSNIGRNNCFELFGYDILLDNYMNPWLLEVNLSPSLAFESPLDLKIKANLVKDTFNLVGIVLPCKRNLFHAGGSMVPKYKQMQLQQIQNELYNQIKNVDGLTWIQKEYLNQFLQLNSKHREMIIETILENQRRGHFVRIYPTKNSDFYDCFLSQNKQNQQVLYQFLYSEVFHSFKDVSMPPSRKFIGINEFFPVFDNSPPPQIQSPQPHNILDQQPIKKPKDNQNPGRISRELLNEYIVRILRLLQEPKMSNVSDESQVQPVLEKLSKLLKVDCLDFGEAETTEVEDEAYRVQQKHDRQLNSTSCLSLERKISKSMEKRKEVDQDERNNSRDDNVPHKLLNNLQIDADAKGIKKDFKRYFNETSKEKKRYSQFNITNEKYFNKSSLINLNQIDESNEDAKDENGADQQSKLIKIDYIIQKLKDKNREINHFLKNIHDTENKKSLFNNNNNLDGGYSSQFGASSLHIPDAQVKAYLNGSSQKILQSCQNSYLIKQMERHLSKGQYKVDNSLFYVDKKHIFDYLGNIINGIDPKSYEIPPIFTKNEKTLEMRNPSGRDRKSLAHANISLRAVETKNGKHHKITNQGNDSMIGNSNLRYNSYEGRTFASYNKSLDQGVQNEPFGDSVNATMPHHEKLYQIQQSKRMQEMEIQQKQLLKRLYNKTKQQKQLSRQLHLSRQAIMQDSQQLQQQQPPQQQQDYGAMVTAAAQMGHHLDLRKKSQQTSRKKQVQLVLDQKKSSSNLPAMKGLVSQKGTENNGTPVQASTLNERAFTRQNHKFISQSHGSKQSPKNNNADIEEQLKQNFDKNKKDTSARKTRNLQQRSDSVRKDVFEASTPYYESSFYNKNGSKKHGFAASDHSHVNMNMTMKSQFQKQDAYKLITSPPMPQISPKQKVYSIRTNQTSKGDNLSRQSPNSVTFRYLVQDVRDKTARQSAEGGNFQIDKNFSQKAGKNKSFTNRAEAYRTTDKFMPGSHDIHGSSKGKSLHQKLTSHKQRTEGSRPKEPSQELIYSGQKDVKAAKKSKKPESIPEKVKSPTIKEHNNQRGYDRWLNFSERDIIASSQVSIDKNAQQATQGMFKKNLEHYVKQNKASNSQVNNTIQKESPNTNKTYNVVETYRNEANTMSKSLNGQPAKKAQELKQSFNQNSSQDLNKQMTGYKKKKKNYVVVQDKLESVMKGENQMTSDNQTSAIKLMNGENMTKTDDSCALPSHFNMNYDNAVGLTAEPIINMKDVKSIETDVKSHNSVTSIHEITDFKSQHVDVDNSIEEQAQEGEVGHEDQAKASFLEKIHETYHDKPAAEFNHKSITEIEGAFKKNLTQGVNTACINGQISRSDSYNPQTAMNRSQANSKKLQVIQDALHKQNAGVEEYIKHRKKSKDFRKKSSRVYLDRSMLPTQNHKSSQNGFSAANSSARQQSKQKYQFKLVECYGRSKQQLMGIAAAQKAYQKKRVNMDSACYMIQGQKASQSEDRHLKKNNGYNSNLKSSNQGSKSSLQNVGHKSSSRIMTMDDIIAPNVYKIDINYSQESERDSQ